MEEILGSYHSGDNNINIIGQDDKYAVVTNGVPVLTTSVFPEALSKYYRDISTISSSQQNNPDMTMNMFGNEVVRMNRVIIPRLAQLGKLKEASFVKALNIQLETIYKGGDIPSNMASVPSYNDGDMNQGTNEINLTPSRQLISKPKKLVLKEASTGMQPFEEEDLRRIPVEKPTKISSTYQQKLHPSEQRALDGETVEPAYIHKERLDKDEAFEIGKELGVDFSKVDLTQLAMGIPIEHEHKDVIGNSKVKAAKIALAHLKEVPDYYTKLKKYVETDVKKDFDKMEEGDQVHENVGLENKTIIGRTQEPISGGKMEKATFSMDAPKVVNGDTQEPIDIRKEGIGSWSKQDYVDNQPEVDNMVSHPRKLILRRQMDDGGDVEENGGEFFKNSKDFDSIKTWIKSIIEE
jgi:hypothetical protein